MSAPSFLNPPGCPSTVATVEQTRELAAWILDRDRLRPLVVLTALNDQRSSFFDPLMVQPLVEDVGDVVVIEQHREHAYTRELQRQLPSGLNVFNGAARIYWPIAAAGVDPASHPLVRAESDDSTGAAKRSRLANRWKAGPPRRPVGRPVRPSATPTPAPAPTSGPVPAAEPPASSGAAEDSLFLAIAGAYLRLVDPHLRAHLPLRPHLVHPDLAGQLDALEPAREPVAAAAAAVLSGHAWTQPSPLPVRVERDGKPVLREGDRAVAWRYPLEGSDRHLFYWQPAQGPVVLVRIAEASYTGPSATATTSRPAEQVEEPGPAPVPSLPAMRSRARGSFTIDDEDLARALRAAGRPLMVSELRAALEVPGDVSADVVRRVLDRARDRGVITRTGARRGTRYSAV